MTNVTSRVCAALALAAPLLSGLAVVAAQRPDLGGFRLWPAADQPGPQTAVLIPGDGSEALFKAKDEVVQRLIDGRTTLVEAASWFRALNRPGQDGRDPASRFPGASEGERLCRQVIAYAKARAGLQSYSQAELVERRLEAELRTCLERDGEVRLPGM